MEKEKIQTRKNLLKRLDHKSVFLANMSHEIRTPLNGIIGFTDIILTEGLDNDECKELVMNIKDSGLALLNLVNDILDFSKIEAGKIEIDPRAFSLRQCMSQVYNLFDYVFRKKGIEYILIIDPNIPDNLKGDDTRLRQILLNLIGNAIKFINKGSVTVRVEQKEDEMIQFDVIDTGIGIAETRLPKLFISFTQAEASISRSYGGTGLGLAISKNLAELMGGSMWVTSKDGEGSTFSFMVKLPAASLGENILDIFVPLSRINLKLASEMPLKILAAEDNEINLKLLKTLLRNMGYDNATFVENGSLAVDAVFESEEPFQLVLMDLQMPVESGISATKRIRANKNIVQPRIIAVTAAALKEEENAAMEAGCDGVSTKPLVLASVDALIRKQFAFIKGSGSNAPS